MGVDLLTKFVEENRRSLLSFVEWFPVGSEDGGDVGDKPSVVLDGLGVLYFIYNGVADWRFSGGWSLVRAELARFIGCLRAVATIAAVVMDGAVSAAKLEETRTRFQRKAADAEYVMRTLMELEGVAAGHSSRRDEDESYCNVRVAAARMLPLGDRDIFIGMLLELGLRVVVAEGEADRLLVQEALKTDSYIIARDSDFYVFPSKGYISLDTLSFPEAEGGAQARSPSLFASVFSRNELAALLNMAPALFPLWACLLGNDYVSREEFGDFRSQARRDKGTKKVYAEFYATAAHFAGIETLPRALALLRSQGMTRSQMELLEQGVRQYALEAESQSEAGAGSAPFFTAHAAFELLAPRVCCGMLSVATLNVLTSRSFWCWPLIEDLSESRDAHSPGLWALTEDVRKVVYRVVLGGVQRVSHEPMTEYFKRKGTCAKRTVDIRTESAPAAAGGCGENVPLLLERLSAHQMHGAVDGADMFGVLLGALDLPEAVVAGCLSRALPGAALPLIAVLYMCRAAPEEVSTELMRALIRLCFLGASPQGRETLVAFAAENEPVLSAGHCHAVSAWLTVMYVVNVLNQVLLHPVMQPDLAWIMDGFLLHVLLCHPRAEAAHASTPRDTLEALLRACCQLADNAFAADADAVVTQDEGEEVDSSRSLPGSEAASSRGTGKQVSRKQRRTQERNMKKKQGKQKANPFSALMDA